MRILLAFLTLGFATQLLAADPFEFKDGDRVVFLGSTLVEREQKYGYWELALTLKNADKDVKFRNLGWSGDTVWGEARNGFDQSPKGYERLVQVTKDAKPTVIVICYGHNESFEGKASVPKFTAQLEKLLDDLAPTKARIVLMSPTPFEESTLPKQMSYLDLTANLWTYRQVIEDVAKKKKLEFVDLCKQVEGRRWKIKNEQGIMENGMHLSGLGYAVTCVEFGFHPFDDKTFEAAMTLCRAIVAKNQLVFHQWRPQNETYLFLFRKHEQGNNAKDIPAFGPLIAKAEKEIQELKKALAK